MKLDVLQKFMRSITKSIIYIFYDKHLKMFKLDYDKHWALRGDHYVRPRYKFFASIIEKGSKVLDIGCGDGTNLKYLINEKGIEGYGIDISQTAVNMAKSKGIDAYVKDISSAEFKLVDKFDYIILSEILEHIPNPEELIIKIKNNFKKSLLVSIPNIGYFPHRIRLCIGGKFPIQWRYHPAEHLRYWTTKDFKKWCEQLGLEIKNIFASNGVPILKNLLPNIFANQTVFVIQGNK
jgi:methionine biosynthesis protein MetW